MKGQRQAVGRRALELDEHQKAQAAIERDRLRKGKARYRSHRDPLEAMPVTP